MINKIFIENKYLNNFVFLALSQGVNQLIPLLITPILLSKIGSNAFGQYAAFQYILVYIVLFINFGFLLSATKKVAILSSEKELIYLYSNIFYSKIFNFILILVLTIPFLYFYPSTKIYYGWVLLSSILTGLGYILYQDWLFQGIQNNFFQFLCIFLSKILYVILIIIGIKWFEISIPYLVIIDGLCILSMGFISHLIIFYKLNIKSQSFVKKNVIKVWREGVKAFTSIILVSFFTSINVVFLGIFCPPNEVSIYSVADRIFIILSGLFAIFSRVSYPYLAKSIQESEKKYTATFNHNLKLIIAGVICTSLIILLFGKPMLEFLLAKTIPIEVVFPVLKVLLVALLFQTISALYSYQFILRLKYKVMNSLLIVSALINISVALVIIPKFGAIGAAYATSLSFIFYYLSSIFYMKNSNKS